MTRTHKMCGTSRAQKKPTENIAIHCKMMYWEIEIIKSIQTVDEFILLMPFYSYFQWCEFEQ